MSYNQISVGSTAKIKNNKIPNLIAYLKQDILSDLEPEEDPIEALQDWLQEYYLVFEYNEETDSWLLDFDGERNVDEEKTLRILAPFITEGTYIEMQGEDFNHWRWLFDGKDVRIIHPTITWET